MSDQETNTGNGSPIDQLTKAYKSIQALCDAAVLNEQLEALGVEALEGFQELKETIANLMMPPQITATRVFIGGSDITKLIRRAMEREGNASKVETTFMELPDVDRKAITSKFLEFLHEAITLEELEEWIVVKGPFNMPQAKELVELLKGNDKLPEQIHPMCGPIGYNRTAMDVAHGDGSDSLDGNQKTPYAVDCEGGCGKSYLSEEEYDRQMSNIDARWKCPKCGGEAWFDDDNYEDSLPELQ